MPRLDRYLGRTLNLKRSAVRLLLAQGRVEVDGQRASEIGQVIHRFSEVRCDGAALQARVPRYLMLNKPAGVVSATVDDVHRTVVDLLELPWKDELHIAGRLDFHATGLMLLTNDGRWSRALSLPESQLPKRYLVTVEQPLTSIHVEAFRHGIHFPGEGITTRPAELRILSEYAAEVSLVEGRYHQIKRMFGHFRNRVTRIHRIAVGSLTLDPALGPGESRALTPPEIDSLRPCQA